MQRCHRLPSLKGHNFVRCLYDATLPRSQRSLSLPPIYRRAIHCSPSLSRATPLPSLNQPSTTPLVASWPSKFTSPTDRTSLRAWAALFEDALPPELQSQGHVCNADLSPSEKISLIKSVIAEARFRVNLDPLLYLGADQGRWEAFVWITDTLIEDAQTSAAGLDGAFSDYPLTAWRVGKTLDQILEYPVQHGKNAVKKRILGPLTSSPGAFLERQATADPSRGHELTASAHVILGHIWRTLGSLIIEASDPAREDKELLTIGAQRTIAQLHRAGFIPNTIYQPHEFRDPSASRQPPLINNMSERIMSALYDAESFTYAHEDENLASFGMARARELGPSVWMEFILWCCIYGQWSLEAAEILAQLRRFTGDDKWLVLPWPEVEERLTEEPMLGGHHKQKRSTWNNRNTAAFDHAERFVSAEVAVATIDALAHSLYMPTAASRRSQSAGAVLDLISSIKSLLNRGSMSLGSSTWDTVIAQLAETPPIHVRDNPNIMEAVLERLSETYGAEISSSNAPGAFDESDPSPLYIFRGSAIVIALYHEILSAFITLRDVNGARRVVRKLQTLTDTNKLKSISDFFGKLAREPLPQPDSDIDTLELQSRFPGITFPSFFSQIPAPTLGRLLDLCTDSQSFETGHWLLRDDTVEEAIIPPRLFANETIAPAVVRFAAATNDMQLMSIVTNQNSQDLASSTIVALCEAQLRKADWEGAARALLILKQLPINSASIRDFARFVASLLVHFGTRPAIADPSASPAAAVEMLSEILRGRFGKLWGTKDSQLDSVMGFLSSVEPGLSNLCSARLRVSKTFKVDLPVDVFDILLAGVARAYGSSTARTVFEIWCNDSMEHRSVALPQLVINPSGRNDPRSPPGPFQILNGTVEPRISTLRVIIQQALYESTELQLGDSADPTSTQNDLFDWLAKIMRMELGLSDEIIDYELGGFVRSSNTDGVSSTEPPYYSNATLRAWRAISMSRKRWVERTEDLMREFTTSPVKKFVVTEPGPPIERNFVSSLASDLKLNATPVGEEPDVGIKVTKKTKLGASRVPELKVADVAGRYFRDSWRKQFPMSVR